MQQSSAAELQVGIYSSLNKFNQIKPYIQSQFHRYSAKKFMISNRRPPAGNETAPTQQIMAFICLHG
jgi:hypothetical protein